MAVRRRRCDNLAKRCLISATVLYSLAFRAAVAAFSHSSPLQAAPQVNNLASQRELRHDSSSNALQFRRRIGLRAKAAKAAKPEPELQQLNLADFGDAADYNPDEHPIPELDVDNQGRYHFPMPRRPRRNRKSAAIRAMVRENVLLPEHLIYPLFVHDEVREPTRGKCRYCSGGI